MALPAVDGRQYVYRVHAPAEALLAGLFREAWHCHDGSAFPRAWDPSDAAVIRRSPERAEGGRPTGPTDHATREGAPRITPRGTP
ncbi:hypothetical protein ACIQ1J_15500 [Streptomyces sp. NPDC097107]|uniref:hypothetical protein n=1 Tax=Streptomyces sp. NPDC097107 TaxID=3366089 RepID=UPI00381CFB9E